MATELKCEGGGGRLPISRSAIPAGSQARMLLTYIRLVEGGRLKARREASTDGARNRLAARGWRCTTVANAQGVGWLGSPVSLPTHDPLDAQTNTHVEERANRRAARERPKAQATRSNEAGLPRTHEAEASSSGTVRPRDATVHIREPAVWEPRRSKATVQPQSAFKPGDRVMYKSRVEGWVSASVVAVDHGSLADGEERAYTILWGDTERGTLASKICAVEHYSSTVDSSDALKDTEQEIDVSHSDGEIEERWQEGEAVAADDYVMGDEWIGDGSAHLLVELDQELQHGDLIFQREDTSTGCQLTGHYAAGRRGVVPWSQASQAEDEASEDPPQLGQLLRFDRTRQVCSTPWRWSGARVRLVDCTYPRLRGMEGVV